jgi:hypothetical protein
VEERAKCEAPLTMSVTWEPLTSTGDEQIRLNMVMLAEDAAAQRKAMRFYSRLLREMEPDCGLDFAGWLMDSLACSAARITAMERAANADILLLSIHGASRLPHELDAWLDAWSTARTGSGSTALVLLCDRSKETWPGAAATRDCLRKIARSDGIEFFEPGRTHPQVTRGRKTDPGRMAACKS